ncbi:hypothetical protein INS49_004895 [Diaporthe citri]|uniref:uncharacterized protein n=1 Tax=Diaporthe citri TaxID=83186 RepID=UPI001C810094|nr:uncharacterized protein INS49_004895 [Diaporthe citri]KAG6354290.1 hypothetical protein INS49_004895 [Diaporthe citri]
MSHEGTDTETLVARLSHQPETLLRSLITISDPPRPPVTLRTQDRPSSLGALDRLPAELLHEVLGHLDVQSFTRLSRTCSGANTILGSNSSYQHLLSHAADALAALSWTELIHRYPLSQLDAVLQSQRCETCPGYGAFLFLPTCERCCWQCLQFRPERLVVPPGVACKALDLTAEEVQELPLMTSIPGRYGTRQLLVDKVMSLVAVAHSMELAVSFYESAEQLREVLSQQDITGPAAHTARFLQRLLWVDDYFDAVLVPDRGSSLVGRYFGLASIRFPSLVRPDRIEYGHWCRGCEWVYDRRDRLPADAVAQIAHADLDPDRVLLRMARTAYSTTGFLEHIHHCYGAQKLLSEPVEEA